MNRSSNSWSPLRGPESGRGRPLSVLLVEDDEDDYIIVRDLLAEIEGWKVGLKWVSKYEAGLEAIQSSPYDVCLIDYRLGARSGLEFLRQASELGSKAPMVLLTGQGRHEIDVEAMKAGAADYLVKGQIDAALLERSLRYAVERAKTLEALRLSEETLRRAHDELKETNAELEAFTYTVSHDLRAPLRAVKGFGDALLEDCIDRLDPAGQDYVRHIVASARRMDVLIQDLLAYSRLSRADLRFQPVSLTGVVADALAQMEEETRERKAQITVQEPLPEVRGHRATLVQVVANLLGNAVKFTSPGESPRVQVRAEEGGGRVRLWVEDGGIGIAPEHQERIFRVFERLHGLETYPGTGIGLAIVRKGMERMGGRAGVASKLGEGSLFWIELPKAEAR